MKKFLVWGSGAIGGTVGAYLARAGALVTFVDRDMNHVKTMNSKGLFITGQFGEFTVPAEAYGTNEVPGKFNTILLCTKSQDTEKATKQLLPNLSEDGCVVSLQNGLNEEVISSIIGARRTVGAFVNFGADYMKAGEVHYAGRGAVVLGEIDGRTTPRVEELHRWFLNFEENAIITNNIWGYLWAKEAYGAMLFVTALTNDSIADAFDLPAYRELYLAIAHEVLDVAKAFSIKPESFNGFDPVPLSRDDRAAALNSLNDMVVHNRRSEKTHSGIWRDIVIRKRKTEVDYQLGPVVGHAEKAGVAVPITARLIELIHDIENGTRSLSTDNLDLLMEVMS
jgi:2-dehydropantoate 2-reductase